MNTEYNMNLAMEELSPEQKEKLTKQVTSVFAGETTLAQEMNVNTDELEAIYAVAYNTYQAKKYKDAAKMFGMLCAMNPLDYRFVFGIASCFQLLSDYPSALIYFQLAAGIDTKNPAPMLHSAECMLALKDKESAKHALQLTLERTNEPHYLPYKNKAEVMLENLN